MLHVVAHGCFSVGDILCLVSSGHIYDAYVSFRKVRKQNKFGSPVCHTLMYS